MIDENGHTRADFLPDCPWVNWLFGNPEKGVMNILELRQSKKIGAEPLAPPEPVKQERMMEVEMEVKIAKTTIEFSVIGKGTYDVLLNFGKTKQAVVGVVEAKFTALATQIQALKNDAGDCEVEFIFKASGHKTQKVEFKALVADVFKMEYLLVQAQKEMLDEVVALG